MRKSKDITVIQTDLGVAIPIVRFQIAANRWRFKSLRTANGDSKLLRTARFARREAHKSHARTISAMPPYCALWGLWCLNMANWVRYPLPFFWAFPSWRACAVDVRCIARYGRVSRTGPLRTTPKSPLFMRSGPYDSRQTLCTPPPILARRHFSGRGVCIYNIIYICLYICIYVYICIYYFSFFVLMPAAAGILYAPPSFIHPPPLEGYFQGWRGGWYTREIGTMCLTKRSPTEIYGIEAITGNARMAKMCAVSKN